MYRLACKDPKIESACRRRPASIRTSASNLNTDHDPLIQLYRKARAVPGIKRVLIASGLRYDLAVRSPAYVRELVTHHVGGYLKIAPEHTEQGPLSKMMKPGIGSYDRFKQLFERFSARGRQGAVPDPVLHRRAPRHQRRGHAGPGALAQAQRLPPDQVQAFLPTPMATATAMYHSGGTHCGRVGRDSEQRQRRAQGLRQRRLHKAFLRWHDPNNWPLLREALKAHGPRRPDRQRQAPPGALPASRGRVMCG
jgi:radical SAM superfamily enzyme YgiQ (UPF0313 family)